MTIRLHHACGGACLGVIRRAVPEKGARCGILKYSSCRIWFEPKIGQCGDTCCLKLPCTAQQRCLLRHAVSTADTARLTPVRLVSIGM